MLVLNLLILVSGVNDQRLKSWNLSDVKQNRTQC